MALKNLLITGGAGFVGSETWHPVPGGPPGPGRDGPGQPGASRQRAEPAATEGRRGRVPSRGYPLPDDFDDLPPFDLLIDCSAEPSVQAGLNGSPRSVLDTNLVGTINRLEAARASRRIPVPERQPHLPMPPERPALRRDRNAVSLGQRAGDARILCTGIAESFTLAGARSFCGESKLAAEQLIQEYVYSYGMRRSSTAAVYLPAPGRWARSTRASSRSGSHAISSDVALRYTGFGGLGKQVRDVLHVHDLFDLLKHSSKRRSVGRPRLQCRRRHRPVGLAQGADRALHPGNRKNRPNRTGPRDGRRGPSRLRDRRPQGRGRFRLATNQRTRPDRPRHPHLDRRAQRHTGKPADLNLASPPEFPR